MQAAPSGREASYASGVVLMCAGVACLSANDAVAKALTSHYSPLQILFLRNVTALPFTVLIAITMGGRQALKTYRPAAHLLRGALWVCATMMFFTSFIYLGLAEATALIFVAPFFITLISALFLGEKVHIWRWLAVLFGFLGVLVVIRPGGATFQAASLLPVATALVYALLMLSARWVDARESVWTLLVYLTGTAALISVFIVTFLGAAIIIASGVFTIFRQKGKAA